MKPITVKQLAEELNELIEKGKGDYPIFLTDDEECNGYHGCWFNASAADEMDDFDLQASTECNCDAEILEDPAKAVYLG